MKKEWFIAAYQQYVRYKPLLQELIFRDLKLKYR